MKEIPLTQGKVALVDDEDFEKVAPFKWYAVKHRQTFYAHRTDYSGGRKRTIRMHRFLMGAEESEVDHINGNGLDNRRANLRLATAQQNAMNRRLTHKGVRRRSDRPNGEKPWIARIRVEGKPKFLGCFRTKEEAEAAYKQASEEHFGEFAVQN